VGTGGIDLAGRGTHTLFMVCCGDVPPRPVDKFGMRNALYRLLFYEVFIFVYYVVLGF